ncbi:MAG: aminodeoxychorismate synthase component I [Hellea sp.]|nr:aminodeoxychorismate synthase component I [Hellea sp.]MDG2362083.1 aminodeoxychorismate synthase component I [Hellea sp.]
MENSDSYIFLDDQITQKTRFYTDPIDIITIYDSNSIRLAMQKLLHYHGNGYHLAGYLSYELGMHLESKLNVLGSEISDEPLMHFGVFNSFSEHAPIDCLYTSENIDLNLKPSWTEAEYKKKFERTMTYIRQGDAYQVNLTFPMRATFKRSARTLYSAFRSRQKGSYGGIISLTGGPEIISHSPELFFSKFGKKMTMRPMKGTRPRAETAEADNKLKRNMKLDEKSQAENLMIVDLLRNDLSRISDTGSVKVPELFSLETYPTLHQMTSQVTSKLKDSQNFIDIFKGLFPCGSVTGAPKIRAMEIIKELEESDRGAYCGSIGYIDPEGTACFNVGIRTIILKEGELRYNVGSGLVMDSDASDEYAECILKADVLKKQNSEILETFLWQPRTGVKNFSQHKKRLIKTANELKYPFKEVHFQNAIKSIISVDKPQRVRLALNNLGEFNIQQSDYEPYQINSEVTFSLSKYPLSDKVQVTRHKVSDRNFYDGERNRIRKLTEADEVIFLNNKNEICEGSYTSIFIKKNGVLVTPPLSSGLLPGILRADLLEKKQAIERKLTITDIIEAKEVFLGNSLRGLMKAKLLDISPL